MNVIGRDHFLYCTFADIAYMKIDLDTKLQAMLWDIPKAMRSELAKRIPTDPVNVFLKDEQLFIKHLTALDGMN